MLYCAAWSVAFFYFDWINCSACVYDYINFFFIAVPVEIKRGAFSVINVTFNYFTKESDAWEQLILNIVFDFRGSSHPYFLPF
jgi:hypothetical protein